MSCAALCAVSEGTFAARAASAPSTLQHPCSVPQLPPSMRLQDAGAAASGGDATRASPKDPTLGSPVLDSRLARARSLSSNDSSGPEYAEASLGLLMAGMSLGQGTGSASLSISLPVQLAPTWPQGYAAQSFPSSATATGSISRQGASGHRQQVGGCLAAVVGSPHYPVQPPQTPRLPPPPIHSLKNHVMQTSSSGDAMLQVHWHP